MANLAIPTPIEELPICTVCGLPIDELAADRVDAKRLTVYTARCHGDAQRFTISDATTTGAVHVVVGALFNGKHAEIAIFDAQGKCRTALAE